MNESGISFIEALTNGEGRRNEERDFLEARCSMKMWPVKGTDDSLEEACRKFPTDVLEIPPDTAENVGIHCVRRVRQARRSRIDDEILFHRGARCHPILCAEPEQVWRSSGGQDGNPCTPEEHL